MRHLFACIWLFSKLVAFGINPPHSNAIASSLGGASATYESVYGLYNNVAALRSTEQLGLSFTNYFGLSEYSIGSAIGGFEYKGSHIAGAIELVPRGDFQSSRILLGANRQLDESVWMGVGFGLISFQSTDPLYQTGTAATLSAGLYYTLTDDFAFGIHFDNLTRSKLSNSLEERLPASVRLGVKYKLNNQFRIYADAFQQTESPFDIQSGIEFSNEKYDFRGGFSYLDESLAIGLGYHPNKLKVHVTAAYHNRLGISPFLTLLYAFD